MASLLEYLMDTLLSLSCFSTVDTVDCIFLLEAVLFWFQFFLLQGHYTLLILFPHMAGPSQFHSLILSCSPKRLLCPRAPLLANICFSMCFQIQGFLHPCLPAYPWLPILHLFVHLGISNGHFHQHHLIFLKSQPGRVRYGSSGHFQIALQGMISLFTTGQLERKPRGFLGGPVVKTLGCQCREKGFNLWSGD